ncbi:SMR family transporter [Methylibium sp.]|uniref:SMR family transporter n=1 Tax=Methylibium sp. TaxID=2067992 RepID=UPI003D11E978
MSTTLLGMLLVLVCAGVEALAQICLKLSTQQPRRRPPWIAGGVALFAVEAVLYTAALQRLDVSIAYPLGALSFVAAALGSAWLLGESLPLARWLGIMSIVAGCALLASRG